MKIIKTEELKYMPASHEDSQNPASLKKILFKKNDLSGKWVQMINWCLLNPNQCFKAHYHESMEEIFIIIKGEVQITAGEREEVLKQGDAVIIKPKEVHTMKNLTDKQVYYLAIGLPLKEGGVSVVI